MDTFEPPKYVSSLIEAVNDGAKTAQRRAVALSLFGLYLLAVCFSTSDQDVLLGHTTNISQFGVQIASGFAFGLAAWVFVALHVFTLIRYSLLSTNLFALKYELEASVHKAADQERCRQLLANVDFVMALIAPRTSALHSRFFPFVYIFMISIFPVFVLLIGQLSALRFQSSPLVFAQKSAFFFDLFGIVWFFWPRERGDRRLLGSRRISVRRWMPTCFSVSFSVIIFMFSVAWVKIPEPDESVENVRFAQMHKFASNGDWTSHFPQKALEFFQQPLDDGFCPWAGIGCRYLNVSNQVLFAEDWPTSVATMRNTYGAQQDIATAGLKGEFLQHRQLRFSDLSGSELPDVDLTNANLTKATLEGSILIDAHLTSADFDSANLVNANLTRADLTNASLINALLIDAKLDNAKLIGADMEATQFSRADLRNTIITCAEGVKLSQDGCATLTGAILIHAMLQQADLSHIHAKGAQFVDANLTNTKLVGADLDGANLEGAILRGADLESAILSNADLDGADLLGANLKNAIITNAQLRGVNLRGTDLEGANLTDSVLFRLNLSDAASCTDLTGATLSDATILNGVQYDRSTKFSPGLYPAKLGLLLTSYFMFNNLPDSAYLQPCRFAN